MSIVTEALYDVLAGDATLAALLASYKGQPAVFTTQPVPGDAQLPYVVTAGEVVQMPFDTKTTRGRELQRDVRFYDNADGSAVTVEAMAERGRALLHRQALDIDGYQWLISEVTGPIVADESDVYGRIITVRIVAQEDE